MEQVKAHPERTRAFLAASLKGWKYALEHKEETAQLILNRYSRKKPQDALLFEAMQSELLIQPNLIELGSQTAQRWLSIANSYRDLGMLTDVRLPDGLIYRANGKRVDAWLMPLLGVVLLIVGSILAGLLYKRINRGLKRASRTSKP